MQVSGTICVAYHRCRTHQYMSTIRHIALTQYRNYEHAAFDFHVPVTCITGPNGTGKTNLLDAVYYLCYTKSYFTSQQQLCIQSGKDGFRIEGFFEESRQQEKIVCKWRSGLKEISINDAPVEKVTDYIGRHAAVMIAPDDMELINDGSEQRRKWMDSILGQTNKAYLSSLLQYQRILQQRKAWLKLQATYASADSLQLDFYDAQLVAHGTYIHQQRAAFITSFIPFLERFYRQLSAGSETIRLVYESHLHEGNYAAQLSGSLSHDLRTQRTGKGIHKDELLFLQENFPAKQYASQGQKKSFLFALKLAQHAWLSTQLGYVPILLLDDVFEKLDQDRMEALLRIISGPGFGQVLLTDTHEERVAAAFGPEMKVHFVRLSR